MIGIEPGYFIKVSSRKNKKYDIYTRGGGAIKYLLSFGDNRYQQYEDSTPLKHYKKLDHKDKKRRQNYYNRHGRTNEALARGAGRDVRHSPKYWSNKYLW